MTKEEFISDSIMEFIGINLSEIVTRQVIYFVIIFFVGVLLLHIATKILDFKVIQARNL